MLVGVTGLELSRADFYEKELSFQVSCSYGPGRYDPAYEEGGQDYPVGFVRWTEQRNFEAVLDLMASEQLDVGPLISHRFPLERAAEAYALLTSNDAVAWHSAGVSGAGRAASTGVDGTYGVSLQCCLRRPNLRSAFWVRGITLVGC